MQTFPITIHQSSVTYPIYIGHYLISQLSTLINLSAYSKIAIVTDEQIAQHYLPLLQQSLSQKSVEIIIPAGEQQKNLKQLETIWQTLTTHHFDRKSLLINLGGGVITDLGGFAASTYMRGIAFVNIPTTLLSQVDASIGGKTGINFGGLKNNIGTFQQPAAVIIDTNTLTTLPQRELNSGFAEIIKHGLIADKAYFQKVTAKSPQEYNQTELTDIILGSDQIKANIVAHDVKEETGKRKLLNFGHTIGHAIESIMLATPTPLLHGEAISLGMLAEAHLSYLKGYIAKDDVLIIKQALENAHLPTSIKNSNQQEILTKLKQDKKNTFGQTKWTLLEQIGKGITDVEVKEELVKEALAYIS